METVQEYEIVKRVGSHLLAQVEALLDAPGNHKRVSLWRLLRSHREKLIQLCTILSPSYDGHILEHDLRILRDVQKAIDKIREWTIQLSTSHLWRPQASPVLTAPIRAHGWKQTSTSIIAVRSERSILVALGSCQNAPHLVQLISGEAVLETHVWRIRVAKWEEHWVAGREVELLLEPGFLPIAQDPPMATFSELLRRVWHVCGLRYLSQLSTTRMPDDPHLVVRFMPNAAELHFYAHNVLCVKICTDEREGLRLEKDGVIVNDVPIWRMLSANQLIEEVRERRLTETRAAFMKELAQWQLFSEEEVMQTEDGLLIRVKESPQMELEIVMASRWGHLVQVSQIGPVLSLLRPKTSGWGAPGFEDLSTHSSRRKAMHHLRHGAFLASVLEGCQGRWEKVKEAEFEETHTLVTLMRTSPEVSGNLSFECYEWGVRNVRAGWPAINFYLLLDVADIALSWKNGKPENIGTQFWNVCNAALEKLKYDEWDTFISAGTYNMRNLQLCGPHQFSWEKSVHLHLLKAPLTVDPAGCVTGLLPGLEKPPRCDELLVHHFPDAVLTVQPARLQDAFEYKGPIQHFFRDLCGIEGFIGAVNRGGLPKNIWKSSEFMLDFPEEDHAPAVSIRPNEVRWARPFKVSSALEIVLKSKGIPAFIKARKQWGPLLHALPGDTDIPYLVVDQPPALVWFFSISVKTGNIAARRMGAVFVPGQIQCWTKFYTKCGKSVAHIPHLGPGVIGKLATELSNLPSIISYLKSFWMIKQIQDARSRRQMKLTQFPPTLTTPAFSCSIGEEDDGLYTLDFICNESSITEAAFGLWDTLRNNIRGLINFLNFLDMMKDTDIVEKHCEDVVTLLEEDIPVDWIERPPEVEKNDSATILKFFVGPQQVTVHYSGTGFSAFVATRPVEGSFSSIKDLADNVRARMEENIISLKRVRRAHDTGVQGAEKQQDAMTMPPPSKRKRRTTN